MDIPLNRVLKLNTVNWMIKEGLRGLENNIEIVRLSNDIEHLTDQIDNACENNRRRHKENEIYFE